MKNFQKFRQNLSESELVQENGVTLPPNILILRRQTVRQFAGHTLVALYYNDKLDQYFSIPFGGAEDSIITPSAMKEETEQLDELNTSTLSSYLSKSVDQLRTHSAPFKRYKGVSRATSKLNLRTGNPDPQTSQAAKDALNHLEEGLTGPTRMQLQKHFDSAIGTDREKLNSVEKTHGVSDVRMNSQKQIISWKNATQSSWDKTHGDVAKHMEEETLLEVNLSDKDHEVIKAFMNKKPHSSKKLSTDGKKLDGNWMGGSGIAHHSEHGLHLNELGSKSAQQVHRAIKKHNSYDSHSDVPHYKNIIHEEQITEVIEENVIEHLRSIKEFHTRKAIKHGDGKQTTVDPTTAHALLTVHDALSDENKKKFAEHLGKSKQHFNKMLDFTWKSVK